MSNRAIAGIVTAANLDTINMIWQYALPGNLGPENFGIPLSADGLDPATHYGMYAASVPEADAIEWQQLCDGTMPTADWEVDPLTISEATAIAACGSGNLILNSQAGGGVSIEHWNGVINGLGLVRIEERI